MAEPGALTLTRASTIDETTNPAIAAAAAMARAVLAAHLYIQDGALPSWAQPERTPPHAR